MPKQQRLSVVCINLLAVILCAGCSSLALYPAKAGKVTDDTANVRQASYEQPSDTGDEISMSDDDPGPESKRLKASDFNPKNLGKTFARLTGKGPNRDAARDIHAAGQELYRQALTARAAQDRDKANELFAQAADQFAEAAGRWPDSALEEDALFHEEESHFFTDRYAAAAEDMEKLIKKYPNTRYLDMVGARRFLIAKYWLDLDSADHESSVTVNLTDPTRPRTDTFGHAIRVLDKIRLDDPLGKLADDATLAAGNAYFTRGDFVKADHYYTDLRTSFPSSEHQFSAHFLGVKAKLESYQGPDYSGTVLDQAKKLIDQIRRQFPAEMRAHEEEIDRAEREVRYRQAERKWYMANYYARRREYGASQFYLMLLLKDYHDTPFAEKARQRLPQITGKPAEPPQKLAWLVSLFPDDDITKPLVATAPSDKTRR